MSHLLSPSLVGGILTSDVDSCHALVRVVRGEPSGAARVAQLGPSGVAALRDRRRHRRCRLVARGGDGRRRTAYFDYSHAPRRHLVVVAVRAAAPRRMTDLVCTESEM